MTNLKIHPFLILLMLLINLPLFAAEGQLSKIFLVSCAHQIVATIYRQGQGFGEVLSFRSSDGGEALMTMKSNEFERPVIFRYHGENFVHVSTTPAGSGAFATDTIFWIAPDATMHEIDIEDAAEAYEYKVDAQEIVLYGGSGVNCAGGKLKFEFYIANDTDPHCCPTAGKVTGNYRISGKSKFDPITKQYSSTFRMGVNQFLRTPIPNREISTIFAE